MKFTLFMLTVAAVCAFSIYMIANATPEINIIWTGLVTTSILLLGITGISALICAITAPFIKE